MSGIKRKLRLIITTRWMLALYLTLLVIFLLLFVHCKYSINQILFSSVSATTRRSAPTARNQHVDCYLFLLIMTSPQGLTRRKAMRETWLSKKQIGGAKIEWRFVIGAKDLSSVKLKDLHKEQETFSDLLFLLQHKDTYSSLTEKLLKSFVWMASNVQANFIMKVDDDSFARLEILIQDMIKRQNMKHLYWGFFRGDSRVKKIGQWAERNWYLSDHYLPYALGGGYIVTKDLVDYVARIADMVQLYNSEDVSLGVWLSAVKLNRIHDIRFDTEYKSRGCSNEHVVSHKQNEEDMYMKHDELFHSKRLCKTEKEVLYTFEYNWKVSPSQCCKRVPRTKLKKSQ